MECLEPSAVCWNICNLSPFLLTQTPQPLLKLFIKKVRYLLKKRVGANFRAIKQSSESWYSSTFWQKKIQMETACVFYSSSVFIFLRLSFPRKFWKFEVGGSIAMETTVRPPAGVKDTVREHWRGLKHKDPPLSNSHTHLNQTFLSVRRKRGRRHALFRSQGHVHGQLMRVGCVLGTCQVQNLSYRLYQLIGQRKRDRSSPVNPRSPHSYGWNSKQIALFHWTVSVCQYRQYPDELVVSLYNYMKVGRVHWRLRRWSVMVGMTGQMLMFFDMKFRRNTFFTHLYFCVFLIGQANKCDMACLLQNESGCQYFNINRKLHALK